MELTKAMLDAKLKQIARFEQTYGADHGQTNVTAMKKFCTDKKYRQRVQDFNQSIAQTFKKVMRNPNAYGVNNTHNENNYYEL